jgi:phage terminase large subunit-like protein
MSVEALRSLFKWLRKADPDELGRFAAKVTPTDLLQLDAWFELWAHKSQLPPNGEGWRVWLMMAGRGFGKTRAGAEYGSRLSGRPSPTRGRSWWKA